MLEIKVCIKMRPTGELRKEEKQTTTDSDSLDCSSFLQSNNFRFDNVFNAKCDNGKVYSSIVQPIVDSCINGYNGTVLAYGATSTGKNHTMMGSDTDPGIVLYAVQRLFNKINNKTDKIRVAFVEILTEKMYNLINDRKRIMIDTNRKIDQILSDEEIPVDSIGKMLEILFSANCQRKSSPNYKNELSHAVFRITIQSEDEANGTIRKTCLQFVHVSSCEPLTGSHLFDSLLEEGDKCDNSWLGFNVVMNDLSEGKTNIKFLNSALTTILREPLTSSNVAIICNIHSNTVAENISTLKFANRAKNVRTKPVRNRMYKDPDQSRVRDSSDDSKVNTLEHQLLANADDKVENLLLRRELDEVKAAFKPKIKWFEDRTNAAECDKRKLEVTGMEERELFVEKRNELELQIKTLSAANRELSAKVETLQKKDTDSVSLMLKQGESLNRLKIEICELKKKIWELKREHECGLSADVESDVKRKIDHEADDRTKNYKMLKSDLVCKRDEREAGSSTSAQWSASEKSDATEVSHTMSVPNQLVGCLIGVGGCIMEFIRATTGVTMKVSNHGHKKKSDRFITVHGTATSVAMAVDMIKQRVKTERQRNSGGRGSRPEKL